MKTSTFRKPLFLLFLLTCILAWGWYLTRSPELFRPAPKQPRLPAAELDRTTMQIQHKELDLGTVKEGDQIKFRYEITNTGNKPLWITDVIAGCGCTQVKFNKEPNPPGSSTYVEGIFDSKDRSGFQRKNIIIYSNSQIQALSVSFLVRVIQTS